MTAPASARIDEIINGFRLTPVLHAAAELRIADLLDPGPMTIESLAAASSANAEALGRLLRTLAANGIFALSEDGRWKNTELSLPLRESAPDSMHATARMWGSVFAWRPYGDLTQSVRDGLPAFDRVFGERSFDWFGKNPEHGQIFNRYMIERTGRDLPKIVAAWDFGKVGTVADIGGNEGRLLASVLQKHTSVRGLLFDLPEVVVRADTFLKGQGVRDRVDLVSGNFFADPLPQADAYVLKWILHDWTDEECVRILSNLRKTIPDRAPLLIIEQVVHPSNPESYRTDIAMMVMTGGRERSEAEYVSLLDASGFRLEKVVPTGSAFQIIEAYTKT